MATLPSRHSLLWRHLAQGDDGVALDAPGLVRAGAHQCRSRCGQHEELAAFAAPGGELVVETGHQHALVRTALQVEVSVLVAHPALAALLQLWWYFREGRAPDHWRRPRTLEDAVVGIQVGPLLATALVQIPAVTSQEVLNGE